MIESGLIQAEEFQHLLRAIAQKRRRGIVAVRDGAILYQIIFVNGKIVEAHAVGDSPVVQTAKRLEAAEILSSGAAAAEEPESYLELMQLMITRAADGVSVDENLLRTAVRTRVMDTLFTIFEHGEAEYEFNVHGADHDPHFSPAISIPQLLLDIATLAEIGPQFAQIFSDHTRIVPHRQGLDSLTDEERRAFEHLAAGDSVALWRARALLDRLSFVKSALTLYRRTIVVIEERTEPVTSAPSKPLSIVAKRSEGKRTEPGVAGELTLKQKMRARLRSNGAAPGEVLMKSSIIPALVAWLFFFGAGLVMPLLFWRALLERF